MSGNKLFNLFILIAGISIAIFFYRKYRVAPVLDLPAMKVWDEELASLELPKGKAVVLHFYASWCAPCLRELPVMNSVYERLKAEGVEIIALTDDSPEKIERISQKMGLKFPVYKLENPMKNYGVHSYPTSYFLDKKARVLHTAVGKAVNWDSVELEEIIEKIK